MKYSLLAVIFILTFYGCGGIGPSPISVSNEKSGFSGTITFLGDWPSDIKRTHIVVFKDVLNSPDDFSILNIRYVSLEIPYGVSTYNYSSIDSSYIPIMEGEYSYIAVVQSKNDTLSLERKDWFVAGLYYNNNDTTQPGKIVIPLNTLLTGINIICDFNNPPPQPPGDGK